MKDILASNEEKGSWRELIRPGMRFAMLIACVLAVLQQLSGASILIEYMPTVFQDAGFPDPSKAILRQRHPQYLVHRLHHRGLAAGRSPRPQAASADWHRRHGRSEWRWSALVSPSYDRRLRRGNDVPGHGGLPGEPGAAGLAHHVGDLPQSFARQGHDRGVGVRLDRVLPGRQLFSPHDRLLQRGLRLAGDGLLDLCRRFAVGLFLRALRRA